MEIFIFDTHWQLSTIIAPYKFTQCHSSEGCLFLSEKTCDRVLEANKKQVPLKSYSLKKELILPIKSWRTKKKLHKPAI